MSEMEVCGSVSCDNDRSDTVQETTIEKRKRKERERKRRLRERKRANNVVAAANVDAIDQKLALEERRRKARERQRRFRERKRLRIEDTTSSSPNGGKRSKTEEGSGDWSEIQDDLENFMEVKLMGRKKRLKRNVLPHLNLTGHENYSAVCYVRPTPYRETENLIVPDLEETRESLPLERNATIEKSLDPNLSAVKEENEERTATDSVPGIGEENFEQQQHLLEMEAFVKEEEDVEEEEEGETRSISDQSVDPLRIFKKEDEEETKYNFGKLEHDTASMRDNNLEKLDMELLIEEVKKYPEIWKVASDEYQHLSKKRNAWFSICRVFCEGFDQKEDQDKKEICNILIKKWQNVKDNFLKSVRRKTKSGEDVVSRKGYVYARHLSFLQPGAELDVQSGYDIEEREKEEDLEESEENKNNNRDPPEINFKMHNPSAMDFRMTPIPPSTANIVSEPNTDRLFFESILPSLNGFTEDQKLEFRCEVLNAIQRIRKSQRNEVS